MKRSQIGPPWYVIHSHRDEPPSPGTKINQTKWQARKRSSENPDILATLLNQYRICITFRTGSALALKILIIGIGANAKDNNA